ncbi:aKG-HExxH-type peptide beta-hydroxylase [Lentzea terrae]|uniref:aKG-HExxH-type peptide beta-hydroxylase n=1 Tax=Lentzea terrae TaxID=2200761 RepID=UPI000DD3B07E|nr:HEXXH motif-containing putative peptide modification protein [Lentzea terrae]
MTHRISRSLFLELARGGGGPEAIRLLRSARRSRTLMMISLIARHAAPDVRAAYEAWKAVSATDAADLVLAHPLTGAAVSRASRAPETAPPSLFAGMAVATAIRAGADVRVDAPCAELFLPTVGRARGGTTYSVSGGLLQVDGLPHLPFPPVRLTMGNLEVELDSDVDVPRWQEVLAAGWDELSRHHLEVAQECAAAITTLSVIPSPVHDMASATAADAFGCVYLSLPPDPRTAALALTHELQHGKLSVLMDLFPLTSADSGELYYAPWRPDPRPLAGLLHGIYAHLGVAAFWRRYHDHQAEQEHARWRTATRQAAATALSCGKLTELGTVLVTEIAEVLDGWTDTVSPTAQAAAEAALIHHRTRWETIN